MEKEEIRKRQSDEEKARSPVSVKRPRSEKSEEEKESSGDLGEEIISWFLADGGDAESITELFKLLDSADTMSLTKSTARIRFIDDPYSSQLIFQSSSSYITINGNEESCGSSFSDFELSLMASVDKRGILGGNARFSAEEWFWSEEKGEAEASECEWDIGGETFQLFCPRRRGHVSKKMSVGAKCAWVPLPRQRI